MTPGIIALGFAYWYRKVDSPRVSPSKASLFYFFTAAVFIFLVSWYTAKTAKIFCGALASQSIFIGTVHLITNDSEKYQQKASVWVNVPTGLMIGTGVLMLAMDYSNTRSVFNPLIAGFVLGSLGTMLDVRLTKWRKVNL